MTTDTELTTNDALADLLPGERLYQQFSGSVRFTQKRVGDDLDESQIKDLPPDRMWNTAFFHDRMYREPITLAQAEENLREHFADFLERRCKGKDVADPEFFCRYVRSENWCLTWFNHYTFDVGLSDDDVLKSFGRFVLRCQCANERARYNDEREPFPLMGAEDRWRWKGAGDLPAPCRCDDCRKAGLVRVNH